MERFIKKRKESWKLKKDITPLKIIEFIESTYPFLKGACFYSAQKQQLCSNRNDFTFYFDPYHSVLGIEYVTNNNNKLKTNSIMNQTKVKVQCVSKKEERYYMNNDVKRTTIELEVPYNDDCIYHKMSGETNFELKTINQAAADMFVIGNSYDVLISPTKEESK